MQPVPLPDTICKKRSITTMAYPLAPCLAAVAGSGLLLGTGAAAFIAAAQLISLAGLHMALKLNKSRRIAMPMTEQGGT